MFRWIKDFLYEPDEDFYQTSSGVSGKLVLLVIVCLTGYLGYYLSGTERQEPVVFEGTAVPAWRSPAIRMEADGVIRQVFVREGKPVKHGDTLFAAQYGGNFTDTPGGDTGKVKAGVDGLAYKVYVIRPGPVKEGALLAEITPKGVPVLVEAYADGDIVKKLSVGDKVDIGDTLGKDGVVPGTVREIGRTEETRKQVSVYGEPVLRVLVAPEKPVEARWMVPGASVCVFKERPAKRRIDALAGKAWQMAQRSPWELVFGG